ncbi:50S ribosomal protein L18e [Nanoarchaeota archaeon]
MKRTGPTNPILRELIQELKKEAIQQKVNIWKRIATDLERPTRQRRIVNLTRINKHTKDEETIIVPGKVLGGGMIDHKVIVAAYDFSDQAVDKISKANGNCLSIQELLKKNPKGSKIKILG